MKKKIIFLFGFLSLLGVGYLWVIQKGKCLFYSQGKCYTCQEEADFLVGLPENCSLCANRFTQYTEYDSLGLWTCSTHKDEITLPLSIQNKNCPKEAPLKDILGHCYPCATQQPVRLHHSKENVCLGKRYLTEFRLSEKSHKCPPVRKIQNPEICLTCQGFWHQEKCIPTQQDKLPFCQTNTDCAPEEYCYPFRYQVQNHTGICRPHTNTKWLFSDTEGYNTSSAHLFCERQGAHLADLHTIRTQQAEILKQAPHSKIWVHFEEGTLYLDSIKEKYPITNEALENNMDGDNFYVLCQKD